MAVGVDGCVDNGGVGGDDSKSSSQATSSDVDEDSELERFHVHGASK